MNLFGVDIKGLVLGSLTGQLRPATLHKRTLSIGAYGESTATTVDHETEGVRLAWKTETMIARGYPMDAAKILLLQKAGVPAPALTDHVTIESKAWRIIDVMRDPVDATWTLAAVAA